MKTVPRTSTPFIIWRHALAGVLIAIGIPATTVLWRYWHRPLFANQFVQSELDPLPDWRILQPSTSDGGTFLTDWRCNIIVIALPWWKRGDFEYVRILQEKGGVLLQLREQTLRLSPHERNRLFIVAQSGTKSFPSATVKQKQSMNRIGRSLRNSLLW